MIRSFASRTLAAALSAVTLSATLIAVAQPATAADDPLNLGPLQANATSGVLDPVAKTGWLTSVSTADGQVCPAGFRSRSGFYSVINGTLSTTAIASVMRSGTTYPPSISGVNDGETHVHREGSYVGLASSAFPWSQATAGATVELRHTCQAATAYTPATDPYYAVTITIEPGGAWSVSDGATTPKTDTTTALTATAVTSTSATLTATVAPADATGTVTFKRDGVVVGSPVTVAAGSASIQVSDLTPSTTYAFTADYSGDALHKESTAPVSVTTEKAIDDAASEVVVEVPAVEVAPPTDPTGLTISVKPGATVPLTGTPTRTAGATWWATGELGKVTVNDDRRSATAGAWTLNGKVSDFTAAGKPAIPASSFGWTPVKVGTTGGSAGGTVTADTGGGLSTDKPLATGVATATENVTTTVTAGLSLKVPAAAAAAGGSYTSTLTLTLI